MKKITVHIFKLKPIVQHFIQWHAQDLFQQGKKINESPEGGKNNSAPLAEFDSAPGAEKTRWGAENLIIPKEKGRNV